MKPVLTSINKSRGNILFLILLAVVLFAALSYAVTQSMRGGGKDVSDEDAKLMASELVQYASQVEQAITRIRLVNDCTDTQISFNHDSDGDGNYLDADDVHNNPNAPASLKCHVFHPNGGGVPYVLYMNQSYFVSSSVPNGHLFLFVPVTVKNMGAPDRNDLVLWVQGMNGKVCRMVNKLSGVDNPGGEVPDDPFTTTLGGDGLFKGDYNDSVINNTWPHQLGDMAEAAGQRTGCVCNYVSYSGGVCSSFVFFHVLLAR